MLVEHPNLVPLSLPSAQTSSALAQLRSLTIQDIDFSVKCWNHYQCFPEDEAAFKKRLQDAYDKYTGLGYSDPALSHTIMTVNLLGIKNFIRIDNIEYVGNQIKDAVIPKDDSGNSRITAEYLPVPRVIYFYYHKDVGDHANDDNAEADDAKWDARTHHEMFHAFQHHFEALKTDHLNALAVDFTNLSPSEIVALEAPVSTSLITRPRKSTEYGFGITRSQKRINAKESLIDNALGILPIQAQRNLL